MALRGGAARLDPRQSAIGICEPGSACTPEEFTGHLRWLRDELDDVEASLSRAAADRVGAAFAGTLYTEVPFDEAAYEQ